ncbi:MAG: trypsin-like peptidase domain-containing protein [Deltaproteobacteria bacterium]|nr:trypsin-like peptidase domain-containing protein [Deltaproteobacteria bacterium]
MIIFISRLVLAVLLVGFLAVPSSRAQDRKLEDIASALVSLEGREIRKITTENDQYEVWLKHPAKVLLEPDWTTYSGTGFFVMLGESPYLVTAAHVARRMDFWARATIRGAQGKPVTISLMELCGVSGTIPWLYHVEADVAVLPLKPSERLQQDIEKHFLPYEWIMKEEKAPPAKSLLTVIGIPSEQEMEDRFSPVLQNFKASSGLIGYPRIDTGQETTFFFLDRPSPSGFSGAPVFEELNNDTKLVGLVYGTVSDTAGGGFSAVVPSVFIAETLDGASDLKPSN